MAKKTKIHKGWIRAWIASSMLITIVSFILIYPTKSNQWVYAPIRYMEDQIKTSGDDLWARELFFSRPAERIPSHMRHCKAEDAITGPLSFFSESKGSSKGSVLVIACRASLLGKLEEPLGTAAALSSLLLLAGFVMAWIRNGFKNQQDD